LNLLEPARSIYIRPAAALLQPDDLRMGAVAEIRAGRFVAWHNPDALAQHTSVIAAPQEVWLAAPIVMHAHLESFDAPSSTWPRASFAAWAQALLNWRLDEKVGRMSARESAQASAEQLAAAGCGLVLSSVSEPDAVAPSDSAAPAPARAEVISYPELFEPDPQAAQACALQWLTQQRNGVALHAPFSVSLELAQGALQWLASDPQRRLSIHLGEHAEERAVLAQHTGALAELLTARGRKLPSTRWESSVDWLESASSASFDRLLAVHCGDLSAAELRRLTERKAQVVWCPGTHQYFARPEPAFVEAGIPAPFLGCDSRASNSTLDPLRELRLAARTLPGYLASEWWAALTTRPARWLARQQDWGSLDAACIAAPLRLSLQDLRKAGADLRSSASVCDSLARAEHLVPLAPVAPVSAHDFRPFSASS